MKPGANKDFESYTLSLAQGIGHMNDSKRFWEVPGFFINFGPSTMKKGAIWPEL